LAKHNNLKFLNTREIDNLLVKTTENAKILGDKRAEAFALGDRGRLYELTAELSSAENYTQQAIATISNNDAADISYQYFWQLGRIYKTQGNIQQAIPAYTKSYDALQSLRKDIATINPEVQFSFRDRVEPVYRELVALDLQDAELLETAGNKTASQTRLIQAREVVESLQIAQLNNFFREACIEAKPQQIDAIDPQSAVIYPIILPDKLGIILSLPKKPLRLYQTNVPEAEITSVVEQIKDSLEAPSDRVEPLLFQLQQVYDWLIRPLEAELAQNRQIKTLAFVLDGDLRNIPMSVLHDGKQYLVEKYALASTPSLQLLDPQPLTNLELTALTAGLSKIRANFDPHRDFEDLPQVAAELKQIGDIGIADRSLLNNQFTRNALKQNINTSGSPIVHLATHGEFSSKAEDTFILSWDERINIQQLDDLLRDDSLKRRRSIELLVLSACQTASGDKRATLGLAGVAVKAGARSTVATLWSVVDESTAKIMGEFYRQLELAGKTQSNKAEALRQAQLTLLKDPKFHHPHFWSPFILVGNWR
jgi:CHAT domain-containing protein